MLDGRFATEPWEARYPELWEGRVAAWAPSLGPTGAVLRDWSGRQNHGTLTLMDPATAWVVSSGQYALDFDATNDYVDCGDIAAIDGAAQLSVSAWINQTALTANKAFVAKWLYDTQGNFALQTQQAQAPGNIKLFIATSLTDAGSGYGEETTDARHTAGQWDHIAFNFVGGVGAQIFVNGVACAQSRTGAPPATLTATGTASLVLGDFRGLVRNFNGQIDDVAIYDRVLPSGSILTLSRRRRIAYEPASRRSVFAGSSAGGLLLARRRAVA